MVHDKDNQVLVCVLFVLVTLDVTFFGFEYFVVLEL